MYLPKFHKLFDQLWISPKGLDLLMRLEGIEGSGGDPSMTAYRDSVGVCTIGWGHVLSTSDCQGSGLKVRPAEYVNQFGKDAFAAQGDVIFEYLRQDLNKVYNNIKANITVELNQQQADALMILAFNYPLSKRKTPKLIKAINESNADNTRKEWADINKGGGRVIQGLVDRRNMELNVFFDGNYQHY